MNALRFVWDSLAASSTCFNSSSGMTTITLGITHLRWESIHLSV